MGTKFNLAQITSKTLEIEQELKDILLNSEMNDTWKSIEDELHKEDNNLVKIAFIGQYTAGKSTIISALTGNNDIKISADIATSKVSHYRWGNVDLIDTPGLYTQHKEHDEMTLKCISESDLLVFCITSDLFNEYTLKDFKFQADKNRYYNKIFLLINKMSAESVIGAEFEDLVENYTVSLNRALAPHSLSEYEHSFVDAKDYKEGLRDNDLEQIEYSHFENFISELNHFSKTKGLLGRLEIPINKMKDAISKMYISLDSDEKSSKFLKLLDRLERRVNGVRKEARYECNYAILRHSNEIIEKGNEISQKIGTEKVEFDESTCKQFVEKVIQEINKEIESIIKEALEKLRDDVMEVLESDLARDFYMEVQSSQINSIKYDSFEQKKYKNQIDQLNEITSPITGGVIDLAKGTKYSGGSSFFTVTEVAGSKLHGAVKAVGNFFGYKFKPWQAVKIAKNIGNAMKVIGPALSVFSFLFDVKETADEEKNAKRIQKAQEECVAEFKKMARDIEKSFHNCLDENIGGFDDILESISEKKRDNAVALEKNQDTLNKLKLVDKKLDQLKCSIYQESV